MAFIVQANGPGDDDASVTIQDRRREALATAVRWLDGKCSGVKIIGDGRVYTPEEFALTIRQNNRSS
jgi:hypothetical protein